MKKVAILTFYDELNYGAVLQTYALCKILKKNEYSPFLINRPLPKPKRKNPLYKLMEFKFWLFRLFFLPKTTKIKYRNNTDFEKYPINSDFFIVGSDQVWNRNLTNDAFYDFFLWFTPSKSVTLSYGASFGSEKWLYNESETVCLKKLLNRFNFISVREESAQKLLKEKFNIEASIVLDPTLLINDYSIIHKKNRIKNSNSLVCIKLAKYDFDYQDIVLFLSEKLNLKPIEVCGFYKPIEKKIKTKRFVSVSRWLTYIKDAKLIFTDSYHGMIFSIIYNKNFIVVPTNEDRITRIKYILKQLELEDRLFLNKNDIYNTNIIYKNIDYDVVNSKIKSLRKKSIDFLFAALK